VTRAAPRQVLGVPWIVAVGLLSAGGMLAALIFLLILQMGVLRSVDANTAKINGTNENTAGLREQLVELNRALKDGPAFFRSARSDLRRTARGLEGVQASLDELNAESRPAFRNIRDADFGRLETISSNTASLGRLTELPQIVRTSLAPIDESVSALPGLRRDVRALRADLRTELRAVPPAIAGRLSFRRLETGVEGLASPLATLPRLDTGLGRLSAQLATLELRLREINDHVAALDRRTTPPLIGQRKTQETP
jgi:hypothetical protein